MSWRLLVLTETVVEEGGRDKGEIVLMILGLDTEWETVGLIEAVARFDKGAGGIVVLVAEASLRLPDDVVAVLETTWKKRETACTVPYKLFSQRDTFLMFQVQHKVKFQFSLFKKKRV